MRFGTADVRGVPLEQAWAICEHLDAVDEDTIGREVVLAVALSEPVHVPGHRELVAPEDVEPAWIPWRDELCR